MAELDQLKSTDRMFVKAYPWRRVNPVPWTPLPRPLNECRLALVSSAGLVLPEQDRFDASIKGGDTSFRVIANSADVATLIDTHRSDSFDHTGLRQDQNLAFPLDRLRELESSGYIGSLGPRHLSFMGSITTPGKLIRRTGPEAAQWLVDDGVDIALLVPV
jgi:D-proline reductase (dithiol) PrdB